MKVIELIEKYNQEVEEDARKRARDREERIAAAKAKFQEFCRIWLGDFWDDFQPGEVEVKADPHSNSIRLFLPISFMGYDGDLHAVHNLYEKFSNPWGDSQIDFGWIDTGDNRKAGWVNLSIEKDGTTKPIPFDALGELLSDIARGAPIREENKRKRLEEERANALVFDVPSLQRIMEQVSVRVEKFPDMEHLIRAEGARAIEAIAAATRAREEEMARFQAMQEEGNRIEKLSLQAWDRPFLIYAISFGAYAGDGEGGADVYKETIYTLQEDPDSDGYYTAFSEGRLSRRIRPAHILSTEIIKVKSLKDAPYEARYCLDITSKKYPEVSKYVVLPPVQFWPESFDFDVAEKESEAE